MPPGAGPVGFHYVSSPVVLIPGAPVLVPELSGTAAVDNARRVEQLCALVLEASRGCSRVVVVGTDPRQRNHAGVRSSLIRWGADVSVGRPQDPPAQPDAVADPALIAWWLLDRIGSDLPRTFQGVHGESDSPPEAEEGDLVVVVADGPASLTPRAPVPEDPRGVALDAALADWLRTGGALPDPGATVAEAVGWWSRPAWLALAGLVGDRGAANTLSWAPFGVGYHGARWAAVPPMTAVAGDDPAGQNASGPDA